MRSDQQAGQGSGADTALAGQLLAELRAAHEQLVGAMGEVDEITRTLEPHRDYSQVRFRLSRASLARRMVWHRIYRTLLPHASRADAALLSELQSADIALLHCSSQHVGRWTAQEVETFWPEYCMASRAIRAKMLVAIANEQVRLYPLLERHARAGRRRVSGGTVDV